MNYIIYGHNPIRASKDCFKHIMVRLIFSCLRIFYKGNIWKRTTTGRWSIIQTEFSKGGGDGVIEFFINKHESKCSIKVYT